MPSLKKIPLSGSTHGRPIKVAATSIGSGTTIHTALATTTDGEGDEIVLYCQNSDSVARILIIGFGGTTDPDDLIEVEVPAGTYAMVLPGLLLRNGLVVRAACATANVLCVSGYALRAQ